MLLASSCDEIPKSSVLSDKLLFENGTAIVKGIFFFILSAILAFTNHVFPVFLVASVLILEFEELFSLSWQLVSVCLAGLIHLNYISSRAHRYF